MSRVARRDLRHGDHHCTPQCYENAGIDQRLLRLHAMNKIENYQSV